MEPIPLVDSDTPLDPDPTLELAPMLDPDPVIPIPAYFAVIPILILILAKNGIITALVQTLRKIFWLDCVTRFTRAT